MSSGPQTPEGGLNTNTFKRYLPYIIAVLSFIVALFYNELNVQALLREVPGKLEPTYNWVRTADDISYLRPAENYYKNNIWKDNNAGRQSYFIRTPGYGLFRYGLMRLMGFEESYTYFKYIQLLLFSISVLLLFQVALLCGLSFRYALLIEIIYGLTPFASGFIYYSLTEGITPALMIAYVFFLLLGYRENKASYFLIASVVIACIGITRPIVLLFGAALPLGIYWSAAILSQRRKVAFILLTGFIALEPVTAWTLRSANIAGDYVGLYPIYYLENNSQFRPTHQAIWQFEKAYGTEGKDFHAHMVPLWNATIKGDTSDIYIDSIMMSIPAFVKTAIDENKLRNSYLQYRRSIVYQRGYYPVNTAMPDTLPAIEQSVINDFKVYAKEINSKYWIWCHVAVPFKLFKSLSFHSNLSLYMWQYTYRGRWWMEGIRVIFLCLHFVCCLSFVVILFLSRDKLIRLILGFTIASYFFYLCYFFRGLEERYTLPILPLMLVGLGLSAQMIHKYFLQYNSNNL